MTRENECEVPGVSDVPPQAIVQAQKRKKVESVKEITESASASNIDFKPIDIPERNTKSLVQGKKLLMEYFSLFFSPCWLQAFAEYTNKNSIYIRQQQKAQYNKAQAEDQAKTFTPAHEWNQPEWSDISGPEIGVFLGAWLMMGLEYRGPTNLSWSPWADRQGNEDVGKWEIPQ